MPLNALHNPSATAGMLAGRILQVPGRRRAQMPSLPRIWGLITPQMPEICRISWAVSGHFAA